ncbi:MAG: poly-gamma-glutamate hydrolase family protein [Acidimicrobiales bacterium]
MFAKLLSHPGVHEVVELRSRFGFLAFHGGSLERVTDSIAAGAAAAAGASLYAVIQPREFRWHVPSSRFDPAVSPRLAAFVDHVDVAIAVHGYGRGGYFTTMLLGGRNRELAGDLGRRLSRRLAHYTVLDELERIPKALRGLHDDNPVNRPRLAGVQLELPPRVRGMGPYWGDWRLDRPNPHTEALIETLADTAAAWTERLGAPVTG